MEGMKDITQKYIKMIEAFDCDFTLAMDENCDVCLDDLQRRIEDGDKHLLNDVALLQKLSFGIRNGKIKIMEQLGEK